MTPHCLRLLPELNLAVGDNLIFRAGEGDGEFRLNVSAILSALPLYADLEAGANMDSSACGTNGNGDQPGT